MLDFKIIKEKTTGEQTIVTPLRGKLLLTIPQINKGTAFTYEERSALGLLGKLPHRVETLAEQVDRVYAQFSAYHSLLKKHIYLNNLHDKNQVLFYALVTQHLGEMLPIIYTPIVGTAVKQFSREYRQPRGLYISHLDYDNLDEIIQNRTNPDIDLIVVTDGEGVLGIGDQGIGGMDIPVAKLMVYTICGGIEPTRTLPIFLDVGTNNQELLQDPFYLGCRQPRIPQADYDRFIDKFITCINRHFPRVFLHWEDFGRQNARRLLARYRDKLCTFNDDIQGTGAVTLAAILAAISVTNKPLAEHRIVIFGAGSAGTGIADQIVDAMCRMGATKQQAYRCFWLVDRQGVLIEGDAELTEAQMPFARPIDDIQGWMLSGLIPTLYETVLHVKPTILIGCSAQSGAFTREVVQCMATHCAQPIILPLSNPDEKCEASPVDLYEWTQGRALVATGTAFAGVSFNKKMVDIAQCNNALIFPGIGLGILAVGACRLNDDMLWAAAQALSNCSPCRKGSQLPLLPGLTEAKPVAKIIALAVAKAAIDTGVAECNHGDDLKEIIDGLFWDPHYYSFEVTHCA